MKISLKWQVVIYFLIPLSGICQSLDLPRAIPLEMETFLYHHTYIKITYSAIPITEKTVDQIIKESEIWELGTNEPAEIMTTQDILIENDTLKAGAYSIFTIPEDTTWTVIFNSDVGLFGTYRYNEEDDIFRLSVPIRSSEKYYNKLVIYFEKKGIPETDLSVGWLDKKITLPVTIIN